LLLDILVASAPARIVSVSSDVHRGATIAFDDLQSERRYRAFPAYGRSKLMNVLFTYELARRLQGTGVTANALHPGFVATGFAMNNGMLWKAGAWVAQRFALSLEQGAQTSIYLASSPEVDGVTGKYFEKSKPVKSSAASYDEATMMRLWNVSAQLAGLTETAQA
jgi:NAD(P)-dependent dehydrogenase (short-subunit alcohol dehydrogenase family)